MSLKSSSATVKDLYFALKSNQILKCKIAAGNYKAVTSRLQAAISDANSLLDFYFPIVGLVVLKINPSWSSSLKLAISFRGIVAWMWSPCKVGDRCEVMYREAGLVGSFFVGTIIYCVGFEWVCVQFDTLLSKDGSQPLWEVVYVGDVRPLPCFIPTTKFFVDDVVDVFINDGWWTGQVVDYVADEDYYEIVFDLYDEVSFNHASDMRLNQIWEGGEWFINIE